MLLSLAVCSARAYLWADRDCVVQLTGNTLSIAGVGPMTNWEVANMESRPWHQYCQDIHTISIDGSVSHVGNRAFRDCPNLTTITIGNSVKSIGDEAFKDCPNLTTVSIGSNVTTIGYATFSGTNLNSIDIPANVTDIGGYAFSSSKKKLTSVTLHEGLKNIGEGAFTATALKSVDIPNSVTTIGDYAFRYCDSLKTVTIGSGVESIGKDAFYQCTGVTDVYSYADPTKLTWNEDSFDDFKAGKVTRFHVHDASAWSSFSNIVRVTITGDLLSNTAPNQVLWSYAAGTLTISGKGEMVDYDLINTLTSRPWHSFLNNIQRISVENGVTHIGDFAFQSCSNATTASITGSVESIGQGAFNLCPNLASVTFHEGLQSIDYCAFYGAALTSIDIPASVTNIGQRAFYGCDKIETVTIGSGVTNINADAFYKCTAVTDVYCYANPTKLTWDDNYCDDFKEEKATRIHVRDASAWSGYDGNVNATFTGDLAGNKSPDKVLWSYDAGTLTISGTGAMVNSGSADGTPWYSLKDNITRVVIEEGVTTVGESAFSQHEHLTEVSIGKSVKSIGAFGFYNCTSLASVPLPDGLESIVISAFASTALTSADIPASVTSIGIGAFYDCKKLATVNVYSPSCTLGSSSFDKNADNRTIYVFANYVDAYKNNWSSYADNIQPLTLTANAGDQAGEYWTTYYNSLANCQVGEDAQVFKIALSDNSLEMSEISDRTITKGNGVVLKSASASIPLNYSATGSATSYEDNDLQGTMTRIENPGNAYVLNKKTSGIGFYKLSENGTIGAQKAYLTYDSGYNIATRSFFRIDDTTGIGTISDEREKKSDAWYTIDGKKLNRKPAAKGIYIRNGKAVRNN